MEKQDAYMWTEYKNYLVPARTVIMAPDFFKPFFIVQMEFLLRRRISRTKLVKEYELNTNYPEELGARAWS